jgi:hypothetical protein
MMEALSSSETSFLTKATRRDILEDGIFMNFAIHLLHADGGDAFLRNVDPHTNLTTMAKL